MHNLSYQPPYPMEGSDPAQQDTTPVHCNRCKWEGLAYQLKPIYTDNPFLLGDVIPTPGCPACLTNTMLEFEENSNVRNNSNS